jgi:putative alpha-1,2-mannosidase
MRYFFRLGDSLILMLYCMKPSHHIPYLYAMANAASVGQERIRSIAQQNYNSSVNGLSGVRFILDIFYQWLKSY